MTQKTPVDAMTTRHILFLVFMHGLGAMILDGAINFGLATAMYKTTSQPVHLWNFPNTLAGDATVTVIIQQTLTWILDQLSVRGDVKKGVVAPLRMSKNANAVLRWFVGVDSPKFGQKKTVKEFLIFHVQRVLVLILATWVVYWPIAMGILAGLKNNGIGVDTRGAGGDFNNWPLPEIFKGVYGFALGATTPFVSYVQLIYLGETANPDSESELPARVSDGENDEAKLTDH
ncbi:hypothetical protein BGX21_010198 [Mortierella sp. AD011]|nr:hypothetical protein BGX20_006029 [Mortierella sp. AD010]KAF9402412.1 hypothetical protein BGX21_010198 [Mortierella sp. AD011]